MSKAGVAIEKAKMAAKWRKMAINHGSMAMKAA
jgi:hypothetical protein